jgi:hypothetical protein
MPSYYSSSSSRSFYSSFTDNGKTDTHSFSERTTTDPSGTTVRREYRVNDKLVEYTEEYFPSDGQQLGAFAGQDTSRHVEDVTEQEADNRYWEAMEDAYSRLDVGA